MPNIRPVSDLRNYASVLMEVHEDEPVYLTKNGRGAYAIVDIAEQEKYEKTQKWGNTMIRYGESRQSSSSKSKAPQSPKPSRAGVTKASIWRRSFLVGRPVPR